MFTSKTNEAQSSLFVQNLPNISNRSEKPRGGIFENVMALKVLIYVELRANSNNKFNPNAL